MIKIDMKNPIFKTVKDIDAMKPSERECYFKEVKRIIAKQDFEYPHEITPTQRMISRFRPFATNFKKLLIIGLKRKEEGKGGNRIFAINHATTLDGIIADAALTDRNHTCKYLAEREGLTGSTLKLFEGVGSTMINREDKDTTMLGLYDVSYKFMTGSSISIFPESTWNLLPRIYNQNETLPFKPGVVLAALIQGDDTPITPLANVSVPSDKPALIASEMFKKHIAKFGEEFHVSYKKGVIEQTIELQEVMSSLIREIWEENNMGVYSLEELDIARYLLDVYLIKFGGPFVSFDSHKESTLVKGGVIEYSKDEETGKFGPGVTDKKPGRQLKLYLAARKSYKQKKR